MNERLPSLDLPNGLDERSVFRSLFVAYPDALLLVDTTGTIQLANPAAAALLGYGVTELTGLPVEALVPDAIRPRHAAYREAYAKNPRARPMGTQMELVARRRDGTEVMVEIALSPLQDQGLPYVVAAIRDIGAYPRVKQALKRARYAEYVAQMGRLAVDTRDPELLLQQVPAVAAEALGTDVALIFLAEPNRLQLRLAGGVGLLPEEPVGTLIPNRSDNPAGFVLAEGLPVIIDDYAAEQRFAVPRFYIERGLVSALAVPLTDRGSAVGALSVRSRTPQRYGDDEVHFLQSLANMLASSLQRAQTEEALNHAQRLESVGQLTGGIAHDFNNLLTVIQGNLQVLEEHPAIEGNAHVLQLVGAATRASKRGAELTAKLLAFSRRQVLAPSRVEVGDLVQSLAGLLRRTLDQRIRITVDTSAISPAVRADPGQLESALLNIAINASDAMPKGGELVLRCMVGRQLPPQVDSALGPQESDPYDYASIEISDTGAGMSEAIRDRAFEPFFTTKQPGRGTGLGLSTVYGFVKQSKGAIELDSKVGVGTTVTLFLPRHRDERPRPEAQDVAAGKIPPGLRVLLVEDEPAVRTIVKAFLGTLGCEVTACVSAEQALETVKSLAPLTRFDLLLTDIALGDGMRGTELARRLRSKFPSMISLLMSGFSSDMLEVGSDRPGALDLLLKPFSRQDLAHAIAKALGSTQ